MPRKKVPVSSELPYHVAARCINKEWFDVPAPILWDIFSEQLYFLNRAFDFRIHSFVLMTNHYHMLCQTPLGNLAGGMQYFSTQTSKLIGKESGRINHVYGGRFFRSLINSNHYFEHAYKYVYRNPVCAGLVSRSELYPWSTLNGLVGGKSALIPLVEDSLLFDNCEETLAWLNKEYKPHHRDAIKRALTKSQFQLPRVRLNGKKSVGHELEIMKS